MSNDKGSGEALATGGESFAQSAERVHSGQVLGWSGRNFAFGLNFEGAPPRSLTEFAGLNRTIRVVEGFKGLVQVGRRHSIVGLSFRGRLAYFCVTVTWLLVFLLHTKR